MDVKPVSRVTVADQVLDQLGALILEEKIKPGDKLPTERELAQLFQTTRGRIREALRALALIGLIETRPGDGSYVASGADVPREAFSFMFFREMRQYDHLYEARQLLEPPLYVLALQHITDRDIVRLEDLLDEGEQIVYGSRSATAFLDVLERYDTVIFELTHNSVLQKLMSIFQTMSHDLYYRLLQVPGAMLNSLERRRDITQALKTGDADAVRDQVVRHMESAKQYYAITLNQSE